MHNTKKEKIMIQKITKINYFLVRFIAASVLSYVVLLGVTSSRIVVNKSLISKTDDIKSELAILEENELTNENTEELMDSSLSYVSPQDLIYVYPNLDNNTAALFAQLKQ